MDDGWVVCNWQQWHRELMKGGPLGLWKILWLARLISGFRSHRFRKIDYSFVLQSIKLISLLVFIPLCIFLPGFCEQETTLTDKQNKISVGALTISLPKAVWKPGELLPQGFPLIPRHAQAEGRASGMRCTVGCTFADMSSYLRSTTSSSASPLLGWVQQEVQGVQGQRRRCLPKPEACQEKQMGKPEQYERAGARTGQPWMW